jgi:hypothetical protein
MGDDATSQLTQTFLGHRAGGVILATDIIPVISGTNCSNSPIGPSDCSINTAVNDWHLHSFDEEPSNAPAGNQAHGGSKSLHMGRHLNPDNPLNATYGFRQLTAFMSPPLNIALSGNRALEFWHIARMADDNYLNVLIGQTVDYGIVQLRLDQDSDPGVDDFGPWQRIEAVTNPYTHVRDNKFGTSCKFDPLDDFFDASAGGVTNETMCFPQFGFSNQGEFTGSGASAAGEPCIDADSNGHFDCGQAGTLGPGFTEIGSIGTGVWIKARFDLGGFLGRRAQIRWIFSSIAFGGTPDVLSYNETPGSPGAFDISERDDGWLIDDICMTGLLTNQLNLIIDGGDDEYDSGTETVTCGANLLAETFAEGDDVQTHSISPTGGANVCALASDIVVSAGANTVIDSVATDACATDPAGFCGTATALVDGQASPVTLSTLAAGQSIILDAGASSLDSCVGGSIQYQFVECDSLSGACDAPASGSILKDFSSSSTRSVSPMVATRYAVSVQCPSVGTCIGGTEDGNACDVGNPDPCQNPGGGMCMPGGCDDTALVTVLPVDPGACGDITIGVDCGGGGLCSTVSTLNFNFSKPGPAGVGVDLDRGVLADIMNKVPTVTLSTSIANNQLTADAPGTPVSLSDTPGPGPPGVALYYLASCDITAPNKHSGTQKIGIAAPTARFQAP